MIKRIAIMGCGSLGTIFLITTTLPVRMQLLLLFKRFSVPFREIRFIDGVVSDEGKKLGILTPYTDAVVTIVSEIEEKKRPLQNNLDAMPDLPIA